MNFTERLNQAKVQLAVKKKQLDIAHETNKKRATLMKALNLAKDLESEISVRLDNLKIILTESKAESSAFTQRRIDYLGTCIDVNLDRAFPSKGFETRIQSDVFRGKRVINLELLNKFHQGGPPQIRNGKLCRQLIGFSASSCVADCLGASKLYMDEVFSASSVENLTVAGNILKMYLEEGNMQIFMIEQKPDIYKDLPRREIYFQTNPQTLAIQYLGYQDY